MIALRETTKWSTPNHIYLVNETKSKMFGYMKHDSIEVEMFPKPLSFNTRKRTFEVIK